MRSPCRAAGPSGNLRSAGPEDCKPTRPDPNRASTPPRSPRDVGSARKHPSHLHALPELAPGCRMGLRTERHPSIDTAGSNSRPRTLGNRCGTRSTVLPNTRSRRSPLSPRSSSLPDRSRTPQPTFRPALNRKKRRQAGERRNHPKTDSGRWRESRAAPARHARTQRSEPVAETRLVSRSRQMQVALPSRNNSGSSACGNSRKPSYLTNWRTRPEPSWYL